MKVYGFDARSLSLSAKAQRMPGYRGSRVSKSHTARQAGKAECNRQMEELG